MKVDDLMLMAAAVTVAALSVLRRVVVIVVVAAAVIIVVPAVVSFEGVRSTGHWAGESRAVDTLRQTAASAIGGRVVAVVVAVMVVPHFF